MPERGQVGEKNEGADNLEIPLIRQVDFQA
jgi:hypothetical protein